MVKAIFSNPLTRKVVASTMFATAVVGANATNLKNENNDNLINQTEVMSKDAASIYKVRVEEVKLRHFQHNEKLDKMLLETCDKAKDVKNMNTKINDIYNSIGTYGAAIEIQRCLDNHYIEDAFEAYNEHYAMSDEDIAFASEMISHFHGWKDLVFYNELYKTEAEIYKKSPVPSLKECSEMLDNQINNTEFFKEDDKKLYYEFVGKFISRQQEKTSVNSASDLLAYKSHLLNALAFNNYFEEYKSIPNYHILVANLGSIFVNGDGAIKP